MGPTRLSSRGLERSALTLPHLQKKTPLGPYWTSAFYLRAYFSRVTCPILFRYLTEKIKRIFHDERKSTGKVRVKTLIFTVFNGNGGIFAWKVKFTVFTVKNLFSS